MPRPILYTATFLAFLEEHPELDELSDRVLDALVDEGVDLWPEGRPEGGDDG